MRRKLEMKFILGLTRPKNRKRDWIKYGDRVVIISDEALGKIKIACGRVCSTSPLPGNTDGSHSGVDNVERVVVWGDNPFNPLADSGDDAYEKSFNTGDPLVLKLWEARRLKDPRKAEAFFKGHLSCYEARCVSQVLQENVIK